MPESVKVGDRFWLVLTLPELSPEESSRVMQAIDRINHAHRTDHDEKLYREAKQIVNICFVDIIDPESVESLSKCEIGAILSAIDEHYDTNL